MPKSEETERSDFVIPVSGDSMEPTYHNGDRVLVERCDTIDLGDIGILILNDNIYISRNLRISV